MLQTVIIVLKKGHSDEFVLKETLNSQQRRLV